MKKIFFLVWLLSASVIADPQKEVTAKMEKSDSKTTQQVKPEEKKINFNILGGQPLNPLGGSFDSTWSSPKKKVDAKVEKKEKKIKINFNSLGGVPIDSIGTKSKHPLCRNAQNIGSGNSITIANVHCD